MRPSFRLFAPALTAACIAAFSVCRATSLRADGPIDADPIIESANRTGVEQLRRGEGSLMQSLKGVSAIVRSRTDKSNPVLAVVNGEAITYESIRSDLFDFESRVNGYLTESAARALGQMTREQAEDRVIINEVRERAIDLILVREGEKIGLPPSDPQIDAQIEYERKRLGLPRDDVDKWAEYTLQNYGKTPSKYRESIRSRFSRQQALAVMAGEYGPIRGFTLPVFFPLDVTPAELREEYESTQDRWKALTDIDYTLVSVELSGVVSRQTAQAVDAALNDARSRLKAEGVEAITRQLTDAISRIKDANAEVKTLASVKAAKDADLDLLGDQVRDLAPGAMSAVQEANVDGKRVKYFVRLNSSSTGVVLEFSNPDVQEALRREIKQRKLMANYNRVGAALLDRAIVLPANATRRGR